MKALKYIAAAALVGTGGYLGYKALTKRKASATNEELPEDIIDTTTNNESGAPVIEIVNIPKNTSTTGNLKDKIKRMQTIIGVTADGVIGPKTIKELNKYLSVSSFTTQNADRVNSMLETIVSAVRSLAYNRSKSPEQKGAMWNAWLNSAKAKNFTFDPYITRAYSQVTGRSLYTDYSNRKAQTNGIVTNYAFKGTNETNIIDLL